VAKEIFANLAIGGKIVIFSTMGWQTKNFTKHKVYVGHCEQCYKIGGKQQSLIWLHNIFPYSSKDFYFLQTIIR